MPLAQVRKLAVSIPVPDKGMIGRVDGFIDDLINVFLDTPENCERQPHVVPLAMHVTSRPHSGDEDEPIPRRPILSIPKLLAEGSPREIQIVLGWRIDTRRLLISLPDDKYTAWMDDLTTMKEAKKCKYQELDQLVGRLNHASFVMPITRHFLSRLQAALQPRTHAQQLVRLGPELRSDLELWKGILTKANGGISLNLVSVREPDRVCWSDACPLGIGGYSIGGRAWRIQIPKASAIRGNGSINNLLEFVGMVVNIWLECMDPERPRNPCILAIGDNTSAIGWLFKTSQLDPTWRAHDAHLFVARHLATILLEFDCCIASQHIKGEMNVVADLLSFTGEGERGKDHPLAYDNPPNDILTQRFHSHLPSQVPENFAICQLPSEILSWVIQVLQIAASSLTAVKKDGMRASTESGDDGEGSAKSPAAEMTPSSLCYPATSANFLPRPLSSATATPIGPPAGTLQAIVQNLWCRALSGKPQATWLRRSGVICGRVPCTTREAPT